MFELPKLDYNYKDLEPAISEQVMKIHHLKHHQKYLDNLNKALENERNKSKDIVQILCSIDKISDANKTATINNGGGHYNHSLFWKTMTANPVDIKLIFDTQFYKDIKDKYGDFEAFIDLFSDNAKALFGSGWVWVGQSLNIVQTSNQDNPIINTKKEPLFGLDVWEHSYYLDYKNDRAKYIKSWWSVVDWNFISNRYDKLLKN